MGATTDQIEREIKQTRDRMDGNLGVLERRAASSAVRYGRIAAIAFGVVAAGVAGYVVYRRMKRPTLKDRFDQLSPEFLRELLVELGARVKKEVPSVTVTVNEKSGSQPGMLQSILRTVAPAIVGTASSAVIERVTRPSGDSDKPRVAPAYH
jgi:hypothetical protein